MQCPVDNETLLVAERSGVEIDYCPKCRGVWLDRGELDKVIDRAEERGGPTAGYDDVHRSRGYDDGHRGRPQKHKRKNMLSEIFDF